MINLFWWRKSKAEKLISEMEKKFAQLERDSWIPDTWGGDGELLASKFGGIPFIASTEDWPLCKTCQEPLQLIVQLNLARLPALPPGCPSEGLIQLFRCSANEYGPDEDFPTYSPGSKGVVIRLIKADDDPHYYVQSPVKNQFHPKQIIGWKKQTDYPLWEECMDMESGYSGDELHQMTDNRPTLEGEKLLGWPYWVQYPDYPMCPVCGNKMHMLFQLDSGKSIPWSFGDAGMAHILQCPNHPDSLVFTWSGY